MSFSSYLSRHVFHPLWDWKDGSSRLRILRELERSQWLDHATLIARQEALLREACLHAAEHVPHYRNVFASAGMDPGRVTVGDLPASGRDLL